MKKIILREEPILEISLSDIDFELKNEGYEDCNGVYEFSKINSLRLAKRVNWLVSVLSFIVELILGAGGGNLHKERDQLKFNYNNKPIRISLKGCDLELAIQMVNRINQKIRESPRNSL